MTVTPQETYPQTWGKQVAPCPVGPVAAAGAPGDCARQAPVIRRLAPSLALTAALLVAASCSGAGPAATAPPPSPTPDGTVAAGPLDPPVTTLPLGTTPKPAAPAAPGTLIDALSIDAPVGTRAWRIVYHSRSVTDADIAVTGIVVAPDQPRPGSPVITYGHATTGSADACAPSLQGTNLVPFPTTLAQQGWTIVQTDYEGLGSTDTHPYLVGPSEAHAMLDAVRAAPQVVGSGVSPDSPVVIWGFSQGGHAAAFAGQLAGVYAPELPLVGVALAAPVSDVTSFARRAQRIPSQFGVLVTIVAGFMQAYPELDPLTVFSPEVVTQMGELEHRCIGPITVLFDRPIGTMLLLGPTEQPAFAARFSENLTAQAAIPVPMLVVQGGRDDIIDPAVTAAMVARYCALGTPVQYVVKPDKNHAIMEEQPFVAWTRDRLAGSPAPSTC